MQRRVDELVFQYRLSGHLMARLDPFGRQAPNHPALSLSAHGLDNDQLRNSFATDLWLDRGTATLREIIERLEAVYCGPTAVQYGHITDYAARQWVQRQFEHADDDLKLSTGEQQRVLRGLIVATEFERFVQKTYLGAKSFSIEGAEMLMPLLETVVETAGDREVEHMVLAMAHRGRLNVLANLVGKRLESVFREFEDIDPRSQMGAGDVKHHLGASGDWRTRSGRDVHLSLCFNPSHLEFINPVALGRTRAKQDRLGDDERRRVLCVQVHGDAGIAGEGIVAESLNLSQLPGYAIGGTLHVVVNNLIGFTTTPSDGRSSVYAADVARSLGSPIYHVNGDNPEAVITAVRRALAFQAEFGRDVVVDMYCYRRHGHNEGDEPAFTQPHLYRKIEDHPPVSEQYVAQLTDAGVVTRGRAESIAREQQERLEQALEVARSHDYRPPAPSNGGVWAGYQGGREDTIEDHDTGVQIDRLRDILLRLAETPDDFKPHKKIARGLKQRRAMANGERDLDFAAAEALALSSIVLEGLRVRLSGQDSQRGTFSHRHAVLHDIESGKVHMPLAHLSPEQAPIEVINSPLCEAGALAFEYGYSLDWPDGLVAWEAQFGDFANAAQVIIDQFISSAEDKWNRLTGIVLLLPHGFEGKGPEHSSARLERWLVLAAQHNVQIVQPTTPAQYFHCLRRQVVRPWRKPLVILTPKSLLRHRAAVSPLDACAEGRYQRVLADMRGEDAPKAKRVLLCSGKIYYELASRRDELEREEIAIARLEQLYPLPVEALRQVLTPYADGTPVVWVQEEPRNMGAWLYLRANIGCELFGRLPFSGVYRDESASPATGAHSSHELEQQQLLDRALGGTQEDCDGNAPIDAERAS